MKSNLAKSHDAMLEFLERLIVNSDKWPGKTPSAQRNYNRAKKLVTKAHAVRGVPVSRPDRTPQESGSDTPAIGKDGS